MTNDAKQSGGMAYRLGWVLYWACIVLAGLPALFLGFLFLDSQVDSFGVVLTFLLLVLLLDGLGRAFRYVLSGE